MAEDMGAALQDEVRELKEQLTMYEGASKYGALPGAGGTSDVSKMTTVGAVMDDSYVQLGIKGNSVTAPTSTAEQSTRRYVSVS